MGIFSILLALDQPGQPGSAGERSSIAGLVEVRGNISSGRRFNQLRDRLRMIIYCSIMQPKLRSSLIFIHLLIRLALWQKLRPYIIFKMDCHNCCEVGPSSCKVPKVNVCLSTHSTPSHPHPAAIRDNIISAAHRAGLISISPRRRRIKIKSIFNPQRYV